MAMLWEQPEQGAVALDERLLYGLDKLMPLLEQLEASGRPGQVDPDEPNRAAVEQPGGPGRGRDRHQSACIVIMGSIRVVRRTGIHEASKATPPSTIATIR